MSLSVLRKKGNFSIFLAGFFGIAGILCLIGLITGYFTVILQLSWVFDRLAYAVSMIVFFALSFFFLRYADKNRY